MVYYMSIMGLYRPILAYNMSFMIKYRQYDKRARSNRLQIIILRLIANLFKISKVLGLIFIQYLMCP